MAKVNYALENVSSDMVKAYGRDLGISTKAAINICNTLRGMDAQKALRLLDNVIAKRQAIAYTRFTDGVGHRKGPMASGRFPVKAAQAIQATIKSAIANAANQGLADDLQIVHICAHKAATPFHQGRQRRRAMKRSHVEVALKEIAEKKTVKKASASKSKAESKPQAEEKKAPVKEAKKTEAKPATQSADKQETVTGDAQ